MLHNKTPGNPATATASSTVTAAEADEATTATAQAFINRWKGVTASELSTSQSSG